MKRSQERSGGGLESVESTDVNKRLRTKTTTTRTTTAEDPSSSSSSCSKEKRVPFHLRSLKAIDRRRTNDEIHSTIELCPVLCIILDTPYMQRLRDIKQLSLASFVYVNVNHTRFDHSIGVAHLAERMCIGLLNRQAILRKKCTAKDILCVKLAGLLHDIGHGPFSHTYEYFIQHSLPEYLNKYPKQKEYYHQYCTNDNIIDDQHNNKKDVGSSSNSNSNTTSGGSGSGGGWKHENVSLMMVDAVLESLGLQIDPYNLDSPLKQIGDGIDACSMRVFDNKSININDEHDKQSSILTSRDWIFIKECIIGDKLPTETKLMGRPDCDLFWLYQIVNNKYSGLDVDKMDYFARDVRHANRGNGEIDFVMIEEAIVAKTKSIVHDEDNNSNNNNKQHQQHHSQQHNDNKNDTYNHQNDSADDDTYQLMICYPMKMISAAIDFFKRRFSLHDRIYRHKTNDAVAYMIRDIMCIADPHIRISCNYVYNPYNYDCAPCRSTTTTSSSSSSSQQLSSSTTTSLTTSDSASDVIRTATTSTTTTTQNDEMSVVGLRSSAAVASASAPMSTRRTSRKSASLPMSMAWKDPSCYLRLRDSYIISKIEEGDSRSNPELLRARQLVHRLWWRQLYKCIDTVVIDVENNKQHQRIWTNKSEAIMKDEILQMYNNNNRSKKYHHGTRTDSTVSATAATATTATNNNSISDNDFIVSKWCIDHGCKAENPLNKMRFVPKSDMYKVSSESSTNMDDDDDDDEYPEGIRVHESEYLAQLPRAFQMCKINIFCTSLNESVGIIIKQAFRNWFEQIQIEMEEEDDDGLLLSSSSRRTNYTTTTTPTTTPTKKHTKEEEDDERTIIQQQQPRLLTQDDDDDTRSGGDHQPVLMNTVVTPQRASGGEG